MTLGQINLTCIDSLRELLLQMLICVTMVFYGNFGDNQDLGLQI